MTLLLDIAREQAWYSFRRVTAFAVEFFGGFVTLFLIMYQVVGVPLKESVLWGIGGYVAAYGFVFAGRFLWAVNRRIGELRDQLARSLPPSEKACPYAYRWVRVRRELSFNPDALGLDLAATATMRLRSNTDGLPFVMHSMDVGDNKAVSYKDMTLDPNYDQFQRDQGEIRFERTQNTDVTQRWRVIFTPGLDRHEEATYEVAWAYSGARFLSLEEFLEAKKRLELPADREFDTLSRSIPVSCERLESTALFPARYPIQEPGFAVKKRGHQIRSEMERLSSNGCFRVEQPTLHRGWRLVLDVDRPLTGVSYVLQWKPPDLKLLVECGLLPEDDRSRIMTRLEGAQVVSEPVAGVEKDKGPAPAIRVTYRAYVKDTGWTSWVSDGDVVGTVGQARPMEAVQVALVKALERVSVRYQAHMQHIGWEGWVSDGETAGTPGRALRMEAVRIELDNAPAGCGISYQAHVKDLGWLDWVSDGALGGTTGQERRMEACRIRITTP